MKSACYSLFKLLEIQVELCTWNKQINASLFISFIVFLFCQQELYWRQQRFLKRQSVLKETT